MGLSLAAVNDHVPDLQKRRAEHDEMLMEAEKRNFHRVMKIRFTVSAKCHGVLALACIPNFVAFAAIIVMQHIVPTPPTFDLQTLREWTFTREWHVAVAFFMLGLITGIGVFNIILMCRRRNEALAHAKIIESI